MRGDNAYCYQRFASVYDRLMVSGKYPAWQRLIGETIEKYNVPRKVGLDIACGTGTISKMLDELGFRVIGIDQSRHMLQVAESKVPDAAFYRRDMRQYRLRESGITLAVSFYDALNYLLTDDDMLSCFRSTYKALEEGGIFLFDMNTREHVLASQQKSSTVHDAGDFYSVFKFGGVDRIWTLDIDIFFRNAAGYYRRSHERHVERGYNQEDIIPLLETAGFSVLDVACQNKVYEDGIERPSRLYFTARK